MVKKMTEELEKKVEGELISASKIKKKTISGYFVPEWNHDGGQGNCNNCNSTRLGMTYRVEKYRLSVNTATFGDAKPRVVKKIVPVDYFCKSCGARNPSLEVLAPNFEHFPPCGLGD